MLNLSQALKTEQYRYADNNIVKHKNVAVMQLLFTAMFKVQ